MKKKILFINFGGLGDEILFLPTIISTKKEFPDSEITLALEPRSKGILSLTDIIDETLFADIKGRNKYIELFNLLRRIWTKKFDIVISSGSNQIYFNLFIYDIYKGTHRLQLRQTKRKTFDSCSPVKQKPVCSKDVSRFG